MDRSLENKTYLVKVSQLDKNVSYKKIAKILYGIDPYLYKDFFGSFENSINYIEKALDTDFSIFNKDYLHLLVQNGKIIGSAVIYPKNAEFYKNEEKNLILKNNLEISPCFDHVSEYYKNFINNNKGMYKLASISVDKNYRGQGYGKLIMKRIDEATNGETKYLTVLRENGRAIRTYAGDGYQIVKEFWDYYGVPSKEKVEMASCLSMLKDDNITTKKIILPTEKILNENRKNIIIPKYEYFNNMSKNPNHFKLQGGFEK